MAFEKQSKVANDAIEIILKLQFQFESGDTQKACDYKAFVKTDCIFS